MSNYWTERIAKAQDALLTKNTKLLEKQLKKYYAAAAERVIADFENVHNKVLAQQAEGKQITPALLYQMDAYWQQQGQLRQELRKLGEKETSLLTKIFELHFFDIYYSINIEGATAFSTIDKSAALQLINSVWIADGVSWAERIWRDTELLAETLNEQLLHIIITGKKPSELKALLQERFEVSYSRADALVRTELAHVQTQAAQRRYEDYGIQEVEVWASKDERRCPECGKLHQKRYPIGAQMPIPAHPRCRCSIIPVVE